MSLERYCEVVREMCAVVGLPDVDVVLEDGTLEIEKFEVLLGHFETDPRAMYISFILGAIGAGRELTAYRLMLEANLTVYAQDPAQLGIDPETDAVTLTVRAALDDGLDGQWLADAFSHYAAHGRYWRDSVFTAADEATESRSADDYSWMKV